MVSPTRIVAATGNPGKLAELNALLVPQGWEVMAQSVLGCGEVEESGVTFVENALLKARNACAHTGLAAIADDSGLEVDALGGAPGVRSARYAGASATSDDNIDKLLRELLSVSATSAARRRARFRCVLVLMREPDEAAPLIAMGTWDGVIAEVPAGARGFGYDPVFYVESLGVTAAQLDASVKNRMSHRAQALDQLQGML